jgi:hypothetical protein
MSAEQLTLDLWPDAESTDPATCPHVRATVDVGGGKARCGAWGDGTTWTNCVALGRCTLFETPPDATRARISAV